MYVMLQMIQSTNTSFHFHLRCFISFPPPPFQSLVGGGAACLIHSLFLCKHVCMYVCVRVCLLLSSFCSHPLPLFPSIFYHCFGFTPLPLLFYSPSSSISPPSSRSLFLFAFFPLVIYMLFFLISASK